VRGCRKWVKGEERRGYDTWDVFVMKMGKYERYLKKADRKVVRCWEEMRKVVIDGSV
jgi:hypothetical protein